MKNLAKNSCFPTQFFSFVTTIFSIFKNCSIKCTSEDHIFCLLGYNPVTFSLGFACKNIHMTHVTLLSETQLGEEHFNTNEVHWKFSNVIGYNVALHYKQA